MSDKPPPRDELASEDLTAEMEDIGEDTIEELDRSELGRTLESAADDAEQASPPAAPPALEVIEAEEVEPEEVEPEEADTPEDRPTIPRDDMALADMAEDLALAASSKEPLAADDATSESAGSGPPRPKSVRPPAPLPGPAKSKPPSRPPLPPPPPPPDALDKGAEKAPDAAEDEAPVEDSTAVGTEQADSKADSTPPGTADPGEADDKVDEGEAPTKRMERGTLETSKDGADEDAAEDGDDPSDAPATAADGEEPGPPRQTTPSIPDDDPVAEKGPPGIPSLVQPDSGQKKRPEPPKPARGRKGKRSTVKIPDDSVPAAGDATDELSTETADAGVPAGEPPGEADAEPQEVEGATVDATAKPDAAKPKPEPTSDDDKPAASGEDDAPKKGDQNIFTDDQSIGVLRPSQVMNELPPMGPTTPPGTPPPKGDVAASSPPSARRPPPPRRSNRPDQDEGIDAIEEVIPDRMSLPGLIPEVAEADAAGPTVTEAEPQARRPLPPPRGLMSSDPNLQVPSDPPTGATPPPADVDAFAPEEDLFAAAEAAAKAAEQAAKEAEDLHKRAEQAAKDAKAKADAARVAAEQKKKRPWWVQVFEDDLVRTQDNPRKKDVEQETLFIEKSLRLETGSRVLDLACGPGVHAVELASRGYQMVGVDLSSTMLALANDYNTKRGTAVSFIQGDMRKLNLEDVFDGIYCWSTSFGYFDEKANLEVLKRVARALRTGGRFSLDVINRDFVAPRSPSMAWFEKPGCVCMDEMKFDFYTSRMITKRMVMFEDGRSTELDMSIRMYTLHEMGKLLGKIGLKVIEVSGHRAHRAAYFGCESPRIIITSEKLATES
ncbi:MAG: methyltransferase domain-containing protein [Deltaproteobacteria bacterium]|nr:methyltransferase domain-containing protein [Deltaproteobacteria bacterium]